MEKTTVFEQLLAARPVTPARSWGDTPTLFNNGTMTKDVEAFIAQFGDKWKRTPKTNVWYLSNGKTTHFTIVRIGERFDIAAYLGYESLAEFRRAFESGTHVGNAVYFQTEASITGPALMRWLDNNK